MSMMIRFGCTVAAAAAGAAVVATAPAAAAPLCSATSPEHVVALVELYTSEGCSSCPPADQFLGHLPDRGTPAGAFVPLALHVDYWDDLGWKDRFDDPRYTARQYHLAAAAGSRTVYTPEVFVAGHEVRDWDGAGFTRAVRDADVTSAPVVLSLERLGGGPGEAALRVVATPIKPLPRDAKLFFGFYEDDQVTSVKAGENRGATLHHSHVLRLLAEPVVLPPESPTAREWRAPLPADAHADRIGAVAFVEDPHSGAVLQALALPACSGGAPR